MVEEVDLDAFAAVDVSLISWRGASRDREIAKSAATSFRLLTCLVAQSGSFQRTLFDFRSSVRLGPSPHPAFHQNKRPNVLQAYQCVHGISNILRSNQAHLPLHILQPPSLEAFPPLRPSSGLPLLRPSPPEPSDRLRRSLPALP